MAENSTETGPVSQAGTQPGGDPQPADGVDVGKIAAQERDRGYRKAKREFEAQLETALSDKLSEFGFADISDLEEAAKLRDAAKTDREKAEQRERARQAQLAKATKEAESLKAELESIRAERERERALSATRRALTEVGVGSDRLDDALAAYSVARKIQISEDGDVVVDGGDGSVVPVREDIKQWSQSRRWYFPASAVGSGSRVSDARSTKSTPDYARDKSARLRNLERLYRGG